ncbi:MAG: DUF58 domain-containing protein [Candidatus Hydrogenedentes bacterium]|nr:DUF58 domain-containing protein [Candidatus Hydrogenedentota bacterium]
MFRFLRRGCRARAVKDGPARPWYWRPSGTRIRMAGWMYLLSLFLVLIAALNTDTNLLYLIFGAMLSLFMVSVAAVRWGMRGLRVRRSAPPAVHRGDTAPVSIRIENSKLLKSALSLRIDSGNPAGTPSVYILRIPARRAAQFRMAEVFKARGVHRLPDITLATAFPFGLIERRVAVRDTSEIVVYPRVHAVRPAVLEQVSGVRSIPRIVRGEGDDFFSLRDYIPGDDIRQVAWRASARRGSYVVRELARQTSRSVAIVLDTCLSGDTSVSSDDFEDAVDLAASLAVTFLKKRYAVSIITPDLRLEHGEGNSQVVRVLETLARVEPSNLSHLDPFGWYARGQDGQAAHLYISPDPRQWGRYSRNLGAKVLHPREVVLA